ncbi:MAG: SLC13 family permease [Fusobacterium perfoetens]|uniref:SLC13 family permease n=1 Tax=Fusobacterium perfoetens TaxID=852 RepID=UPI0023F3121E|nr:SLC13 family permease [Fusobacterium perfoetens]MCI6152628.1 SLC13 family permease [Fusobacterium perfoetens]MDY3237635.1 SLC13 family permease [Fusobacterium perfoetens]
MISFLIVLAIAISIALGYKTKINTGLFAIGFAYLIGCFMLDLSASKVIVMWPIKIFFVIFSVSLFYNFPMTNGTLEKLSQHMLYKTRKVPHLLPFAIFFSATLIAGLGAGYFTVLAFFGPLTLILCERTGLSKLTGALAVNYGSLAGANFMTSASGIIFKGLIENAGYQDSFSYTTTIFISTIIIPIVVLSILILKDKYKMSGNKNLDIEVPEKFDVIQKTTLKLIFTMVFLVLIFPILNTMFPTNEIIKFINSKLDIGLVAIIFTIIAFLMKLGKEKEIIAKVPWNTLIMICGVGMLISVAIKAGTIEILSSWIGTNIPKFLIPIILCIVGGIMSSFSSTLGVVAPALFPIVPSIAEATGLNPTILFVAIIVGAQATSISPFSSGGSLILGAATEEERDGLFGQLLFKGTPLALISSTIFSIILSIII